MNAFALVGHCRIQACGRSVGANRFVDHRNNADRRLGARRDEFVRLRTHELLKSGAAEPNPDRRAAMYRQLERHVLDLAPLVPLYHTVGLLAVRTEVRGLEPSPLGLASARLERVWFASTEGGS